MRSGPITRDTSSVALGLAQIRIGSSLAYISQINSVLSSNQSMGAMAKTTFTGKVDHWKLESGFPLNEDLTIPLREAASLECSFKEISSKNLAIARGLSPFDDVSATATVVGETSALGTTTGNITVTNAGGVVNDVWTVVFTSATAGAVYGKATGHVTDFANLTTAIAPDNGGNPYFSIPANFFSGTWAADETFVFETTAFVAGTSAYNDAHAGEIKLGALKSPEFVRVEAVYTYPNNVNHMYIIFPRANAISSMSLDFKAETAIDADVNFEAKSANADVVGGHAVWDTMSLGRIYFD